MKKNKKFCPEPWRIRQEDLFGCDPEESTAFWKKDFFMWKDMEGFELRNEYHWWFEECVCDFIEELHFKRIPYAEAERNFKKKVRFVTKKIARNALYFFERYLEEE